CARGRGWLPLYYAMDYW
nr:immunoglobulin heavy chain junction region [Mus musculus]